MIKEKFRLTLIIKILIKIFIPIRFYKVIYFLYESLIFLNKKNIYLYFDYAFFLAKNKNYTKILLKYKDALNCVERKFHPKLCHEIGLIYFNFIKTKDNNDEYYLSQPYFLKKFNNSINKIIYPPKLLLSKIDFNKDLLNKIYEFKRKTNKSSSKSRINFHKESFLDKKTGTFQSHHNIHHEKQFNRFYLNLEKTLNNIINKCFSNKKHYLKIKNMWFLIVKKKGNVDKHSHSADLSGVVYLKVSKKHCKSSLLIENPKQNLKLLDLRSDLDLPKTLNINNKLFKINPLDNDLIIFNSYLNHSVEANNQEDEDRISLAWDADFIV
tara:strand:+ start:206 stop:1180 length:975 start_codon:yes stop_codon:yes gene_type:complete